LNKKLNIKLKSLIVVITSIMLLGTGMAGCGKTTYSSDDINKSVCEASTRVAATGLGEALKDISGETQRIDFIRKFIAPIRFFGDDSGYFFVYNYSYRNIAIAVFSDLEGKDLSNTQDSHGNYFVRLFADAAKKGGGFVEYYFPHTLTKVDMKKIAYIAPIPNTDYYIGSGYYPDAPPEVGR
jgi:signal transduction histidine kinase